MGDLDANKVEGQVNEWKAFSAAYRIDPTSPCKHLNRINASAGQIDGIRY